MAHHPRNRVRQKFKNRFKNLLTIDFLDLGLHVIRYLAHEMTNGISYFRIRILSKAQHHITDRFHLLHFIYVLPNLRECHNCCIFVPPILMYYQFLNHCAQNWQHDFFSYWRDEPIDSLHSKMHFIILYLTIFVIFLKALDGLKPFFINFAVYANHFMEQHKNYAF